MRAMHALSATSADPFDDKASLLRFYFAESSLVRLVGPMTRPP
jgi:hypothetical protein